MKTFLITYDLKSPETYVDYTNLHRHIKQTFSYWARPVRSVWIVKSNKTTAEIVNLISSVLDNNDRLLVVETSNRMAWNNLGDTVSNWLRENV